MVLRQYMIMPFFRRISAIFRYRQAIEEYFKKMVQTIFYPLLRTSSGLRFLFNVASYGTCVYTYNIYITLITY